MNKSIKILLHLAYWLPHLGINFYYYTWPYYSEQTEVFKFVSYYSCQVLLLLFFFYLNYFLLVPKLLLKKKYVTYFFTLLPYSFAFIIGLTLCWGGYYTGQWLPTKDSIGIQIHSVLATLFISAAYQMLNYWIISEKQKSALHEEVKDSELKFLKLQISPHFLLNTLNNIYGLALQRSPRVSNSIVQLRNLMDYIKQFDFSKKAILKDEIKQLENYIELNLLRCKVKVQFIKDWEEIFANSLIEPMLLLPFVENAFKHGKIDESSTIKIHLKVKKKNLFFQVVNSVQKNKRTDDVGGIGIHNVKRRIELIYKKKASLSTVEIDNQFIATLNIRLDEKS